MNELVALDDNLLPEAISTLGLQVAEAYLLNSQDAEKTAGALNLPVHEVRRVLKTAEVRTYINQVFMETGFRNRERMFGVLDEIINRKLEQMEESGTTTETDIIDIMKTYHKMKMDEMKMERELLEAKKVVNNQKNTQINIATGGDAYAALLESLSKAGR